VPDDRSAAGRGRTRIGAVSYLNTKPLIFCLQRADPALEIVEDLPSRLADRLAAGELDVALVPSIELFRQPGSAIVSDACIASDGPVRSVKLYGRVPPQRIRTLALDEGSRTSAALARILLKERFAREPELVRLPIGTPLEAVAADAAMLIGDRGMCPPEGGFEFIWDLGEEWRVWTGLPFVFALWIARRGADSGRLAELLGRARDEGLGRLEEIARRCAPEAGIAVADCLAYFRENLQFRFGPRQRQGLELFHELAQRHALAPAGGPHV